MAFWQRTSIVGNDEVRGRRSAELLALARELPELDPEDFSEAFEVGGIVTLVARRGRDVVLPSRQLPPWALEMAEGS